MSKEQFTISKEDAESILETLHEAFNVCQRLEKEADEFLYTDFGELKHSFRRIQESILDLSYLNTTCLDQLTTSFKE